MTKIGLLSSPLLQLIRTGTTVRLGEVEVIESAQKEDKGSPRERVLQPLNE